MSGRLVFDSNTAALVCPACGNCLVPNPDPQNDAKCGMKVVVADDGTTLSFYDADCYLHELAEQRGEFWRWLGFQGMDEHDEDLWPQLQGDGTPRWLWDAYQHGAGGGGPWKSRGVHCAPWMPAILRATVDKDEDKGPVPIPDNVPCSLWCADAPAMARDLANVASLGRGPRRTQLVARASKDHRAGRQVASSWVEKVADTAARRGPLCAQVSRHSRVMGIYDLRVWVFPNPAKGGSITVLLDYLEDSRATPDNLLELARMVVTSIGGSNLPTDAIIHEVASAPQPNTVYQGAAYMDCWTRTLANGPHTFVRCGSTEDERLWQVRNLHPGGRIQPEKDIVPSVFHDPDDDARKFEYMFGPGTLAAVPRTSCVYLHVPDMRP